MAETRTERKVPCPTCKRPAVATLDRSWSGGRTDRWAYCEQHLFSRHIHDGAIWSGRLVLSASSGYQQEVDRG